MTALALGQLRETWEVASLWLCALWVPPASVILGLAIWLPWAKRTLVNVKQAETGQALPQLGLAARNPRTQAAAAWTSLQAGSGFSDRCYAARDNWYILLTLPSGDPSSKYHQQNARPLHLHVQIWPFLEDRAAPRWGLAFLPFPTWPRPWAGRGRQLCLPSSSMPIPDQSPSFFLKTSTCFECQV